MSSFIDGFTMSAKVVVFLAGVSIPFFASLFVLAVGLFLIFNALDRLFGWKP